MRQPTRASAASPSRKPAKAGQQKRKADSSSSNTTQKASKSAGGAEGHVAAADVVAHAANALCLISVQQTQTTLGLTEFDREIAFGEEAEEEMELSEKDGKGVG